MAHLIIATATVLPSANAVLERITAGEALTQGMPVYKFTDGKVYKSYTDNTSPPVTETDNNTMRSKIYGIVATGAGSGQPVVVVRYDPALTIGATVQKGMVYVLSKTSTGGRIEPISDTLGTLPNYISIVGQAINTTQLAVDYREPKPGYFMAST